MLNKRNRILAAEAMSVHSSLFQCPVCSSMMRVEDLRQLVCLKGHSFDIAKQGYVHFLPRPAPSKYGQALFRSRSILSQSGFFESLDRLITDQILTHIENQSVRLLDMGCGEGSHLARILDMMHTEGCTQAAGVGLDIAKEGVRMAASRQPHLLWCVADLARSPLASNRFDFILNILSPTNYAECHRLLRNNGFLIKVIPDNEHLQELRAAFRSSSEPHSGAKLEARFQDNFELVKSLPLCTRLKLDASLIPHAIAMTPLSWHADTRSIQSLQELSSLELTLNVTILIGRKYRQ
ncbi:putative RNA methyltransferase [Paenibacillus paeoniae]|uniref:putative RNA methyltransferase n=1 Tax=Paenibacillus paeoniae TaxID=2292705 RepID=UPI001403E4C8|nr:methyltransferase domain-containing protein [Paenibacillus paeoniae]